jgi:hypothetical protein
LQKSQRQDPHTISGGRCRPSGKSPAATALVQGMMVVTRNMADFAATGVPLFNPFE